MPGDYSNASEEPGGHKLHPLPPDLMVETNFAFDPVSEETKLVVANGKMGGSIDGTVGMTLYGRTTRYVSAHELLTALQTNGRAVPTLTLTSIRPLCGLTRRRPLDRS